MAAEQVVRTCMRATRGVGCVVGMPARMTETWKRCVKTRRRAEARTVVASRCSVAWATPLPSGLVAIGMGRGPTPHDNLSAMCLAFLLVTRPLVCASAIVVASPPKRAFGRHAFGMPYMAQLPSHGFEYGLVARVF